MRPNAPGAQVEERPTWSQHKEDIQMFAQVTQP